ncbi:MAG TPA: energy-coupling factor transporter transmembrane component T [Anaerolineales bacterium]|nr:energy-coupling factor transporter transmembrane component T [Anaerolineales bacterium]HLA81504.1 energy-coupling factor transporter transmembrane component T [Thermoleophilia bacterium]
MPRSNVMNFLANVGRRSWFHRIDPRTKIAVILVFSVIPLLFTDWRYILVYLLLTMPLWLTSNLDFRPMAGPLSAVGIFLTIIFLLNAVRGPSELTGEVDPFATYSWFYQLGPIVVTSHTVTRGLFLAMRLVAPMTIGLLVISTTDPTYLAKGLRKLGMPVAAVFMVLAGLRFIPIVTEQLFNILDAQTVRGLSSSRIQRTRLLVLPLFITSLRRTRTMGLAAESKGFGSRTWNEFYEEFKLGWADKAMLLLLAVVFFGSLYVRFVLGYGTAPVGWLK